MILESKLVQNSNLAFPSIKRDKFSQKRQSTDWEKIFANDVTSKGLVSKTYKQIIMFNSIKTNNLLKKWAADLNKYFSKGDKQMAKRDMKRCSSSLFIRDMQIKTAMIYHLTAGRMAIIKKIHKQ